LQKSLTKAVAQLPPPITATNGVLIVMLDKGKKNPLF
jgi:hypothetical protein